MIGLLKDKFDTVDPGDAKFLLGIELQRDFNASVIKVSQEAFANTKHSQMPAPLKPLPK